MSKWHVTTDIISARGSQVWEVEASSAKEALAMVDKGEGEIVAEEIEVVSTGNAYNPVEQQKGGAS